MRAKAESRDGEEQGSKQKRFAGRAPDGSKELQIV